MRAALALLLAATPALAETEANAVSYACDRGVTVPVVYVNAPDQSLAVLVVEGRQVLLYNQPAGSGARYGWPTDGSGYVWWTKGEDATLYWKDGAKGTEEPLMTCHAG